METLSSYLMIGQRIKKARKEANLNQRDLAKKVGIALRTFQKYEANEVNPKMKILRKIAKTLNCELNNFFDVPNDYEESKEIAEKYFMTKDSISNNKLKRLSNKLKLNAKSIVIKSKRLSDELNDTAINIDSLIEILEE